jgi:hypothetical protein
MAKTAEWLASHEAIARVRTRVPGQKDSEFLFAQCLCDGRIKARAKRAREAEVGLKPSMQSATSISGMTMGFVLTPFRNELREEQDVDVPPEVWAASNWPSDMHRWNWGAGIFLLSFPTAIVGTEGQKELIGVEFDVSQLIATYPKPKIDSRNREKSERWNAWVAEVARVARDGEIQPTWGRDDLITHVEEEIKNRGGEPPLGDGAVNLAAAAVIQLLKSIRPRNPQVPRN